MNKTKRDLSVRISESHKAMAEKIAKKKKWTLKVVLESGIELLAEKT